MLHTFSYRDSNVSTAKRVSSITTLCTPIERSPTARIDAKLAAQTAVISVRRRHKTTKTNNNNK